MFTIDDLNNVTAYLLELWGPMAPDEIRQFLDHISRVTRIRLFPFDPFASDPERVIEPMVFPPIQEITRLLEEWNQENPGRNFVRHLFFHGNPDTNQNRRSREEWERNHPGPEEVVVHEFRVGNPALLTGEQRRVVEDILRNWNSER